MSVVVCARKLPGELEACFCGFYGSESLPHRGHVCNGVVTIHWGLRVLLDSLALGKGADIRAAT